MQIRNRFWNRGVVLPLTVLSPDLQGLMPLGTLDQPSLPRLHRLPGLVLFIAWMVRQRFSSSHSYAMVGGELLSIHLCAERVTDCYVLSPDSLKTNNQVRRRVMDSIAGLMDQDVDDEVLEEFLPICSPVSPDQSGLLRASLQPIVDGHPECPTPMMTEELEEGRFHEEPLDVAGGVAVLEESVQLGVPDVVTQM